MSYSKGPLRISGPSQGKGPLDDGGDYAIVEPGGIIVGEAFRRVGEDAIKDAEANARLWAKAPDLLAALGAATLIIEQVVDGINDEWSRWFSEPLLQDDEREWLERAEEFIEQARAALAAAGVG